MSEKVIMANPAELIKAFKDVSAAFIGIAKDENVDADRQRIIDVITPFCDDLDNFVTFLRAEAQDMLNTGTEIQPSYLLVSKSGLACPIILPMLPSDQQEVAMFAACMISTLNFAPIDAYSFMTEMYMAEVTVEELESTPNISPSTHPSRKEAIMIRVASETDTKIVIFEIITEGGRRVLSDKNLLPPDAEDASPNIMMSNLFEAASLTKKTVEEEIFSNRTVH